MSGVIASQQVFKRLPRIQIQCWQPCFPGSLKWNLVKTALSSSTEMEHTSGLYLIIFAMASWPEGATFLKELADEAEFYQIQGILDDLKPKAPKNFEESVILTNEEHQSKLIGWLPQYSHWHQLFQASRDGFTAQAFHAKCDSKGPTVTIVKSGNNIFGGFTENSWNSKYTHLKGWVGRIRWR